MQEYKVTVDSQGTVHWRDLKTDKIHRVDGPAVEHANGDKYWYICGKLHRVDGPAGEYTNGDKRWYLNDKLHRVDGPAVEYVSGYKSWWLNGKLNRVDGHAIEYADGDKEWYLDGVEYTESEFNAKMNSGSCEGREIEIDGVTYTLKVKE